MTIQEVQEELIDEFSMFDDWMQRYEYMIELGKSLPLISNEYKITAIIFDIISYKIARICFEDEKVWSIGWK